MPRHAKRLLGNLFWQHVDGGGAPERITSSETLQTPTGKIARVLAGARAQRIAIRSSQRPTPCGSAAIASPDDARRELEEMLVQFEVLYADEEVVRVAIRGAATYRLTWFDAHMWAYAERFGLETLWSEDFEDGRLYGRVRAKDPFVRSA